MRRMTKVSAAAMLTLGMTAVACSNGGPAVGSAAAGGASAPSSATTGGGTTGAYGAGGAGGYGVGSSSSGSATQSPAAAPRPVAATVKQKDFSFAPGKVKVSSGQTIAIKNVSAGTLHTFTVLNQGIDVLVQPGTSSTVTIDLPPGRYPFECRFHVSRGMTGTLVVK
jgi:plastocyanin